MIKYLYKKTFILYALSLINISCSNKSSVADTSCESGNFSKDGNCIESAQLVSDCKDPDLSKIVAGEKGTLCDGSEGVGTYTSPKNCSSDGEQNCVNTGNFKAADTAKIDSSKIIYGESVAGVNGTLRRTKLCRNNANISSFDLSSFPSNLGTLAFMFNPANVATASDQITLPYAHGLSNNSPLRFSTTVTLPSPLVAGTTYYAIVVSTTVIRVASIVNGTQVDLTTQGTGTHTASDISDGQVQYFDTIDDYNFGQSVIPPNNPWGSNDYLCDSSNFVNVTASSSPFLPSGTIPSPGNQAFTQIWQDQYTGLYFTNVLYDNTPTYRSQAELLRMCESLNGGTAGSGWRMPSQKELMQLYINGISKLNLAGSSTIWAFWSSTHVSIFTNQSWTVDLSNGRTNYNSNYSGQKAICVR